MRNVTIARGTKLVTIAVAAVLGCWWIPSERTSATNLQLEDRKRFEIIGQDVPAGERFGADDGALFVLHFTGDIHGTLEPCG